MEPPRRRNTVDGDGRGGVLNYINLKEVIAMKMISSGTKTVGSFLKDDLYYVPEYQRSYAWEQNQHEDLWLDLMELYNQTDSVTHFFGQIVIFNEDICRKKYIIDGQQRISTSVILLDAFRAVFEGFIQDGIADAKYEVEDITTMYIGRTSDNRFEPRLYLNDTDRIFFAERIQKNVKGNRIMPSLSKQKKSEQYIHEASLYYRNLLEVFKNRFKDTELQYREMKTLLSYFVNDFIFMIVETKDIDQAFIIFETLNARGKELSTADLLKNHVYRTAGAQIADAKVSWDLMIETLNGIDATKYIRHYWNAQYRFIREKDLYTAIRRKMNNSTKIAELMQDLVCLSELYASLNHPHLITYFENPKLIEQNKEVSSLGAKSYYPIMIALVIKGYSESEILRIHSILETFIVRNFTVSGKTANRSEKNFAEIAQKIAREDLKGTSAIIESIHELIITDEEFYDNFKRFGVKKGNVIRYMLRKIHNYQNKETRIIADNNLIHVEHIMPKKLRRADDWKVNPEQHELYVNRLGNLTLLGEEYNRNAVNKDFNSKKDIYDMSEIPMTNSLTNYNCWSIDEIEARQEDLAKIALDIWQ